MLARGMVRDDQKMYISDEVLDRVRVEGFAVVEGFLDADELAAGRAGIFTEFPDPASYFADPDSFERYVSHPLPGYGTGHSSPSI